MIGYRRLFFHDDATKTLQMSAVWLVRSVWGKGFASETSKEIEKIAFETLGANRIARQGGVYPDNKLYDNMMWTKLKSEYNK